MENLLEIYGEDTLLLMCGIGVGLVFGACAQQSKFCLRAATIDVSEGRFGHRLSVWLVAFLSAVFLVQLGIAQGWLDVTSARQLASVGSLSGAIIGGLLFGAGMILARGCASRLLVLSATGNLRAIMTGLVLTLVAQAALTGVLAPAREALAGLWLVNGGTDRSLLYLMGLGSQSAAVISGLGLAVALVFARRVGGTIAHTVTAAGVGLAVAAGWMLTGWIAQVSFEIIPVTSVTFTGPSTDTLLSLINVQNAPYSFGIGLVPGVFGGAAVAALVSGQWRIERFDQNTPMERYLIGAVLMGFGSMLAGGCAVGAGLSGGSIFALTAWVAVFFMWVGAMVTHSVQAHWSRSAAVRP